MSKDLTFNVMGMDIKVGFTKSENLVNMKISSIMGVKEQVFKKDEIRKQFQDVLEWLDNEQSN